MSASRTSRIILAICAFWLATGLSTSFNAHSATPRPTAVDLGLSVKWASMNLGASTPSGAGSYYAWGETSPKSSYTWSNYKWCNGTSKSLTKYNTDSSLGEVDNRVILELGDDAARQQLGGEWRLPTDREWKELKDRCKWTWRSDLQGWNIEGPNGKSIFLPAGGYQDGEANFDKGLDRIYYNTSITRDRCNLGYPIRPVYGKYTPCQTVSPDRLSSLVALLRGEVSIKHTSVGFYFSSTASDRASLEQSGTWVDGEKSGDAFVAEVADLNPDVKYYYMAVVKMGDRTYMGEVCSFTTKIKPATGTQEAVDLGLSVKWASCNVGAKKPWDYGNYYAWGEKSQKGEYSWKTYIWRSIQWGTHMMYRSLTEYDKPLLEPEDDAAFLSLGEGWRMPTKTEFDELIRACDWHWTALNGVAGYMVKAKNGNWIFLPAAGKRNGSAIEGEDYSGHYWSSDARRLFFNSTRRECDADGYHYLGFSVRPVLEFSVHHVTTEAPSDVQLTSAQIHGSVAFEGDQPQTIGSTYFLYSKTASSWESLKSSGERIEASSNFNTFSACPDNLEPGTTYYYAACSMPNSNCQRNNWGLHGEVNHFTTKDFLKSPITTLPPTEIHLTFAKIHGRFPFKWANNSFFLYSSNASTWEELKAYGRRAEASSGDNSFYAILESLNGNTTYYYAACVNINGRVYHGGIKSFVTCIPIPESVDLGLNVKWANCNWGAASPWEEGYLFSWGNYSWTCKDRDIKFDNGRYIPSDRTYKYTRAYKNPLKPPADIASESLGGEWRTPKAKDWKQLWYHCKWEWTEYNGVYGYKVTGKNGNSIFLPAAGYIRDNRYEAGFQGDYWASSIGSRKTSKGAKYFFFNYAHGHYVDFHSAHGIGIHASDYRDQCWVRPVCDK